MSNLQVFSSDEFGDIRTLMIEDMPWWVGKDVAAALGYENLQRTVRTHVDDEDKGVTEMVTPGGKQQLVIINESGLYSLILSSKLPSAKRFKRWITSEVLPALRKTGSYTMQEAEVAEPAKPGTVLRELTTDDYITAIQALSRCRNERLPMLVGVMRKIGLEVDFPAFEKGCRGERDTDGETARLINLAVNTYGMSLREIGRLTGLAATQISRIRTGESTPTMQRATIISEAIKQAIPEIV